jgi:short-subunit dehydrogenase
MSVKASGKKIHHPDSKSKVALITGASSGFGLELAKLFARDGHNLVITARPGTDIAKTASEIGKKYGVHVTAINIDLAQENAAQKLYDIVKGKNLRVGYLINNAGIGNFGRFADNPFEREHELLQLNVVALAELCHHFIPDMVRAGGGKILNVASIAAFQAGAYYATYFSSKAFVLLFSEALALEYKKDNINVTVLCPGVSRTNFFKRAGMPESSWLLQSNLGTANAVALAGYKGLMKGKSIVTPGLRNKFVSKSYRWLPRKVIAEITKKLVEIAGRG